MPLVLDAGTNGFANLGISSTNKTWAISDRQSYNPRTAYNSAGFAINNYATSTYYTYTGANDHYRLYPNVSGGAASILNNFGSILNTTNGIYTLARSGTYLVWFNGGFMQSAGRYIILTAYHNSTQVCYGYHYESDSQDYDCSASCVIKGVAGDTVYFTVYLPSGSYTVPAAYYCGVTQIG